VNIKGILAGVLSTLLFSGTVYAQPVMQQSNATGSDGRNKEILPHTLYNAACNGGAGGFVGQTYSGVICNPDSNNASFANPVVMTAGGTALAIPTRSVDADCSAAGTVTVKFANGVTINWHVIANVANVQAWQIVQVVSAGGATCNFYGMY
jgi:hypothetical protein